MLEPRCGESPQVRYLRGGRRSNASPLPDRWGAKKDLTWLGYKLHIFETCDDRPACGCPPDPAAAASGRCGHDVRPNLITGVATTRASVADAEMTTPVTAALHRRDLAPGRHYPDPGYGSARHVLDAARLFGITLVTPLPADSSRQARSGDGYDRAAFAIDDDTRTVTCPQGRPSTGRTPARQAGRDTIVVRSGITTCRPCPARQLCTTAVRNGRQLTILPRDQHELQAAVRAGQQREDWQEDYKRRAGIEGAVSQAVTVTRCRRARYRGPGKTHLEHVCSAMALNLCRLDAYWNDTLLNRGRTSHLARLSLATSRTELTTNIDGAQARSSARFVRDVVVVVTLRGWPTAPRPSASGVSDLGQVPKLGPGIMTFGLEPVIAWPGIDGVELDQQVRPASGGAQAPGPWFGRGCEGESRPVPGRRSGSFPVALGFGPGTAVPDGVPLLVGYCHAPRRRRVAGGSGGQVAGQPRVSQSRSKYT